MGQADEKGTPVRAHFEGLVSRAQVQHGRTSEAYRRAKALLDGPPVPEALLYLWQRFTTLSAMRGASMAGIAPITPDNIRAANELFGWKLTPLEVEILRALDLHFRFPPVEQA